MIRHKLIDVPLYGGYIYLYSGKQREVNTHFGVRYRYNQDIVPEGFDGITATHSNGNILLWVENHNDFSVLVHEITHTIANFLRFSGMELNEGSEEAYAYLAGYIMDEWLSKSGWKKYTTSQIDTYKYSHKKKRK
jgi:hypothetical protein